MNTSEDLVSPVLVVNEELNEQEVVIAGPFRAMSPRMENSFGNLRASSKEEITSEIKGLLIESRNKLLKVLKPKIGESTREKNEDTTEEDSGSFYSITRSVKINPILNNDPCTSRNIPVPDRGPAETQICLECQAAAMLCKVPFAEIGHQEAK